MLTTDGVRPTAMHPPRIAVEGERWQVSVLFADIVGFTALVEREGEEAAPAIERVVYEMLTTAVREHGGAVRAFAGDSVMAVYGIRDAQQDAALRACRTAVATHAAFAKVGDDIAGPLQPAPGRPRRRDVGRGRDGLGRGEGEGEGEGEGAEATAVGDAVNLASRLQNLAPPGGTLICDSTRRLFEWVVNASFHSEPTIRGRSKPLRVWQLTAIHKGAARFDASLRRGLSPYVGRANELAQLCASLARSSAQPQVVDISAEPGLGKTRLDFECLRRLEASEALVVTGYCTADGSQVPFLPFLDVMRDAFRITHDDDPNEIAENLGLLLNLLGLTPPDGALAGLDGVLIGLRTRDLLPALLAARCRTTTIILLLVDVHWIDGASEQLLAHLIGTGAHPNLLILHTARPEYFPPWRGAAGVTALALTPLGALEIRRIVQTRLGVEAPPDALIRQVTDRAAGNPLFGEEILGFLIDEGALQVTSGIAYFDDKRGETGLPASMQSLLAARTARLPGQDRAVLQAAAAIGRRFDPQLLSLVVDQPGETGPALQRLEAQDILYLDAKTSDYAFQPLLLGGDAVVSAFEERGALPDRAGVAQIDMDFAGHDLVTDHKNGSSKPAGRIYGEGRFQERAR